MAVVAEDLEGVVAGYSRGHRGVSMAVARIGTGGTETAYANCDATTRFDIGSITKVVTAILLCEAVVGGRCRLDDPLDLWLPPRIHAPRFGGRKILLRHLATHTSGLPRLPWPMYLALFLQPAQPYAGWSPRRLATTLSWSWLRHEPGRAYAYSNFGFAVLGLALEKIYGQPYCDLVAELTNRLGCGDLRLPAAGEKRLRGLSAAGVPVEPWKMAAFAPAGGLTATLPGMVAFAQRNLASAEQAALDMARATRQSFPKASGSGTQGMGLGWHGSADGSGDGSGDGEMMWHNGGTAGFRSFLGLEPSRDIAVVVLAAHEASMDRFAMDLIGRGNG